MVVGVDAEAMPRIHHCEEGEVGVWFSSCFWNSGEGEAVEEIITKEEWCVAALENPFSCCFHTPRELGAVAADHELEELGRRGCVLADLLLGGRVEDGEPRVDVPFVTVDAQGYVDFDIFDAPRPACFFPGELGVACPGGAHGEEGGMCDRLSIRSDPVMFNGREELVLGFEAGDDGDDKGEGYGVAKAVRDDDEGLACGIDAWSVEGVDWDDGDVRGKVSFKSGDFWSFARCLPADYCSEFGCWRG